MSTTFLLIIILGVALALGLIGVVYWTSQWADQASEFHEPGTATNEDDLDVPDDVSEKSMFECETETGTATESLHRRRSA